MTLKVIDGGIGAHGFSGTEAAFLCGFHPQTLMLFLTTVLTAVVCMGGGVGGVEGYKDGTKRRRWSVCVR